MWVAVIVAASAVIAQPNAPWCGTKDRDIGRGFTFTQYMFDGSPEFTLHYRPPSSATRTKSISMTGPIGLSFTQMNFGVANGEASSLTGPHVGLYYYPLSKADGSSFTGTVKLDCGGGTALRERYALQSPANFRGQVEFSEPWFAQPEQRCLRELQQTGKFALTMAESDDAPPAIVVAGRIPLRWATNTIHAIWAVQLEDARRGRCRLMPPPPPPF